jgi:hypothetical protein
MTAKEQFSARFVELAANAHSLPPDRNDHDFVDMHADWAKISEPDVNSVIGFVESFLQTKF